MAQKPVKLYVWTYCPFCQRAKALLDQKGVKYDWVVLDGKDDELSALRARTGQRTVPQIFIDDKLIGGYSDMASLDQEGKLDQMLGI